MDSDAKQTNLTVVSFSSACTTSYIMFLASKDKSVLYGATFLIASGAFSFGALTNAQVSANVLSDTARASAIGTNVMMGRCLSLHASRLPPNLNGSHRLLLHILAGNLGGLISTWSFLPNDAPRYHKGNGLNLATSSIILILSILLLIWMKADNSKREKRNIDQELAGLSQKQIQDLDWRHPAFRWKP